MQWEAQAPIPGTTVTNEDLFISARINSDYHFTRIDDIQVFLDNKPAVGNIKVLGNELYFVFHDIVSSGKHTVRIKAYIEEEKEAIQYQWDFFAGSASGIVTDSQSVTSDVNLRGIVQLDNRNEFLSGPGQSLRQEPASTTTLSVDGALLFKNTELSVKIFATSNSAQAIQTMNFYQVGFKNKWLSLEVGDINPNFDRQILTGVRVRGMKAMLKYRSHSLQVCYGELRQANEGTLQLYTPGNGVLPTNLVNDSQYVSPGIYRRAMGAVRLETGNRRDIFKVGLTAFKAKDDIGSISYGLSPKENVAAGMDVNINLLRKRLNLQSGIAASVITNDISGGVIDRESLDTSFNIQLDFDPKDFQNIITLNASTVPTSLENKDFLSYYGQLSYTNTFQRFSIEYKKSGPLFMSLGNPFQRMNYEGIFANERVFLLKRKLSIGLGYHNYSNNLNGSLPATVHTRMYRGNLSLYFRSGWPSLYLNYTHQLRQGKSEVSNVFTINDQVSNYMVNISLDRTFWNVGHHFFAMAAVNTRSNMVNVNGYTAFTGSVGVNESINDKVHASAEFGKMLMSDGDGTEISNIMIYSASIDWQIKPAKYVTAIAVSNNRVLPTALSNQSYRLSVLARFNYWFWKGMDLLLEGGYQPFRDQTSNSNNYNEAYIYLRYSCNLAKIISK